MPPPTPVLVHASPSAGMGRLPLLLVLALSCPAAEVAEMAPVEVGGIVLVPAGDLRDTEHRFEFHPKALLGGGWDSNALVPPAGDGSPDTRLRGLAGILVRYHPRPGLDGELDGELERSAWQRNPELDTGAGLLRAGFDYRAPALAWVGEAVWRRSQESLLTTGEQVSQEHQVLRTRIGHQGGRWWEEATAVVGRLDYRQATASFDERQGDHTTGEIGLRFGLRNGGDRAFLALRGETVRYVVDERFNDCNALTTTAGGHFAASDRSQLHAEAGLEVRRYADDYVGDPANDDQLALAPWWDVGGTWSWQTGDSLEAHLYSDLADIVIMPSIGRNAGPGRPRRCRGWPGWAWPPTPYPAAQPRCISSRRRTSVAGLRLVQTTKLDVSHPCAAAGDSLRHGVMTAILPSRGGTCILSRIASAWGVRPICRRNRRPLRS